MINQPRSGEQRETALVRGAMLPGRGENNRKAFAQGSMTGAPCSLRISLRGVRSTPRPMERTTMQIRIQPHARRVGGINVAQAKLRALSVVVIPVIS